ncbi:MAG: polyphosphate polymerase domain-containing protein [Eubacteriales bacterium]|nr:polyphosphate polymerase domain-containing protein [Eubacteriales bacterium]
MSQTKLTFKRYEKKYLLTAEKYAMLRSRLDRHIQPDEYFKSTVCSVYYDTADYALIRNSIDAPIYKEKLRLRSYNVPQADDTVFVELKEKFKGLVYKRRISLSASDAVDYVAGRISVPEDTQVSREIDWFLRMNEVFPRVFLASDREAYTAIDDNELRITFDLDIRWRDHDLDLTLGDHGKCLTEPGQVLMEIKMPESCPMWLAKMLSECEIFPTGFSKYGACYKTNLYNGVFANV